MTVKSFKVQAPGQKLTIFVSNEKAAKTLRGKPGTFTIKILRH